MTWAAHIARIDDAARRHLGGVVVTYASQHAAPVEVEGLFDAQYVLADTGRADVEQAGPAVWLRLSDLPVHPDDDEPLLTIEGRTYTVRERQPDGAGGIRLLLHRSGLDEAP